MPVEPVMMTGDVICLRRRSLVAAAVVAAVARVELGMLTRWTVTLVGPAELLATSSTRT